MRTFQCPQCDARLFFENSSCLRCGAFVAYDLVNDALVLGSVPCASSATVEQCNWVAGLTGWCASCLLDMDHTPTVERQPFQDAKRRALRQLWRLGVPLHASPPLRFDLQHSCPGQRVVTGHENGLITLDTAEADPARRESIRTSLDEPYRSPLGHVRHETGHWFWAAGRDRWFALDAFRRAFGDERADYGDALEAHYSGRHAAEPWRDRHVTLYASAHPWEDFAESFAHVLHMVETMETARAQGLAPAMAGGPLALRPWDDFDRYYEAWVDTALVLNELCRSMGVADPYPFAPSPAAVDKLRFVVHAVAAASAGLIDTHSG